MMEMGDETDDGSFFRLQRREWKAAIIKQKTNMKTTIKPKKPFRIAFYRLRTMSLCVLRQWKQLSTPTKAPLWWLPIVIAEGRFFLVDTVNPAQDPLWKIVC